MGKEIISGIHLGVGFREWVFECETKDNEITSCKPIIDADVPKVLQNGIHIKTRKGEYGFDLIQLADGKKLLYPNPSADLR